MPNRIIKESICYSEDIDKLDPIEEVFFYRMIVNCDDYGICDARQKMLKSKIFPLKENLISDDIERYLMKLAHLELIMLYENSGTRYAVMTKWRKHQQIRANKSKYPKLEDENSILISIDINGYQLQANAPVIQSNTIQSESNPIQSLKDIGQKEDMDFRPQKDDEIVIIEPEVKVITKAPKKEKSFADVSPKSEFKSKLEATIYDFMVFRSKIKKPMTELAVSLLISELNKIASDDETKIEILNRSIMNNWVGVFPLKDNAKQGYQQRPVKGSTEELQGIYNSDHVQKFLQKG